MAQDRALYAEMFANVLSGAVSFSVLKNETAEKDRNFFNMLFMTTFRQLTFIKDEVLTQFVKKKIPQKQNILQNLLYLGAAEILFTDTPDYAVVSFYVEAAKAKTGKFGANFANAVLRNIARQKERLLLERKARYFSAEFLKILKKDYSAEQIAEMEKFAAIEPPLDLSLKNKEDAAELGGVWLETGSLRFPSCTKVLDLKGYKEGKWWVQDAAAAIAVNGLFDLAQKEVLDLCAAPGGKTAQLLNAGASVTAVDISEKRLSTLKENMARLGFLHNLTVVCADAACFETKKKFDVVLVDAPCSATGTFRRHPEIMHTKTLKDVKKQAELQKNILEAAADKTAAGGILAYVTCSLAKDEGERQINNFLKGHKEYEVLPVRRDDLKTMLTKEGYLRILPQHFDKFLGADGFFCAYLQRKI